MFAFSRKIDYWSIPAPYFNQATIEIKLSITVRPLSYN